jgi:hypothetical protein
MLLTLYCIISSAGIDIRGLEAARIKYMFRLFIIWVRSWFPWLPLCYNDWYGDPSE